MKHVFVVNPKSGPADVTPTIAAALKAYKGELDCEVYTTVSPGDATAFVRRRCDEHPGERLRFYACGGDGTLNEVVSGAAGRELVAVGCYPCGSGNDFVKYYGGKAPFLDVGALVEGEEEAVDLMRVGDRYSVNVCNFGFDATVANRMIKYRRTRLLGGPRSYVAALALSLADAMRHECSLSVDGELVHEGPFLSCTISNGSYVGGSFNCAPRARVDDGVLEVCVVGPISRRRFLKLVEPYKSGRHLEDPQFADCLTYRRGSRVEIRAPEGFLVSLDGEIIVAPHFTVETLSKAWKFIVPKGAKAL